MGAGKARRRSDAGRRSPDPLKPPTAAAKMAFRPSPLLIGGSAVGLLLLGFVFFRTPTVGQSPASPAPSGPAGPASSSEPSVHSYRVVQTYPHDPLAFTQGLFWLNGSLFESTGLYGHSGVREVRLDGTVVREVLNPGRSDFGEGLVNMGGGRLLQLLWRTGRGYTFAAQAGEEGELKLQPPHFHTALSDGWGLEYDGTSLIATDSGPDLFFLDPEDFSVRKTVRVRDNGRQVEMINELELIDGELWANIYGNECLARIEPATGEVKGWVLLDGLIDRKAEERAASVARRQPPDVLNGIAWIPEGRRLLVTGKLWPSLFEVELQPATVDLAEARRRCIPETNIFRAR